ncbi:HAT dimerisation [Penicillium roqueforti FM164]|uniref:HAT dimerisation n=1 Tax=Penicillium roqueforti (strain FM164) TaxID=1365484 RepID=W6Q7G6_PENRF|nr:HAT dimerisation [Penicillium roqueforti FM164]
MPFIQFTTALLASREATVYRVCFVFKILMEHLDESTRILRRKSAPWKRKLSEASLIMKMELGEVYEKTFQNFGVMYGPGTFVAPQYKVSAFDEATLSQGLGQPERYIEYLRIFHLQYRPQMPTSLSCVNGLSCSPQLLGLDRLLYPLAGLAGSSRWVLNISLCAYWKDHQREWPVLTRLARDLLSIPAIGAGTERLLTVAQNICRTCGGSLDESTMRDLVMYAYSEGSESGKQSISRV